MTEEYEPSGRCQHCGYRVDAGGRCSECGEMVEPPVSLSPAERRRRNVRIGVMFAVGACLGFLTWAMSKRITRCAEPWDDPFGYYVQCTLAAGFVTALVFPRFFWLAPFAVGLGEMVYMHFVYFPSLPRGNPIILPSCCGIAMAGFVPTMIGAALCFAGQQVMMMLRRKTPG